MFGTMARAPGDPPPLPDPPPGERPALARGAEALRAFFGGRAARPVAAPDLRLDDLAAAAQAADYFEVLGVPRGCSAAEARLAADALLAALDRALGGGRADDRLAEVRQVVLDARDVLGDDARLDAYRRALGGG